MIFGSVGTVSSSWEPPIPMNGLLEWYEPGNTAGIIIGNPEEEVMDKMVNLVNPTGSLSYQQLFTSEFGSDSLGGTTITTNATSNSWSNSSNWSNMTNYTVIIISKYNENNNQEDTFTNLFGVNVTFNLGNGNQNINTCLVDGNVIYSGNAPNTLWAMYTLSGSVANNLHFYRNTFDLLEGVVVNFQPLPSGTLIFPYTPPLTDSSVGAILLYNREITDGERNSIFQHYKKQFPLSDT